MSSSKVKKVIIEGTNGIGKNAFLKFTNLTDVVISTGVTSINSTAFEGLTSIKNVELSDKITSLSGFKGCTGITSINIPESVTAIWAFDDCTGLTEVTLPKNLKSIYGFNGCTGLTELSIPSTVTGVYGFSRCTGLTEVILPNSVVSVSGFSGCTGLTKLTLSDNLTNLGGFSNCSELTNIVIPSGVLTIDNNAFKGCTKLTNFVIPDKVTVIKSNAFSDCPELTDIIIPNSVTGIAPGAFNNTGLTSIDIPSSVVSLGGFAGTGLTELTIPDTVKTLYIDGFANCPGLKTLNFNATLTTDLTAKPFINTMLETVNIGPDVTSIPSYMFSNQTDLKSLTIPDNVTSIGTKAFQSSGIEAIEIPESIKTIGANAFTDSANLKSVVLSANLTSAPNIFSNSGITDIEISDNVTTLPDNIFSGMNNIKRLEIPSSVTSMKANTFANCLGLTDIIFRNKFSTSNLSTCINLAKVYMLGGIDGTITKSMIPTSAMIYGEKGSSVEAWCTTNSFTFKGLSEDEIEDIVNGKLPSLQNEDKLFDFSNPTDLKFKVNLGVKPAGATGISQIIVDTKTLSPSNYTFNGTDTITVKSSYLKTLYNGVHSVSVLFDNGIFKPGASIHVMNSTVPVVDPTQPPVALDTIKYEFYRDYPDYVIIPVTLNGATKITQLKIGTSVVDPSYYELQDSAIIIDHTYISTLSAGKYRILPTFDDYSNTTITNLQLLVYDSVADRAAPYLLQTRIIFDGRPVTMKFYSGDGDLFSNNILALVIDDSLILPNGDLLDYTSSNIGSIKKSYKTIFNAEFIDDVVNQPEEEVATPSEATEKEDVAVSTPSEATSLDDSIEIVVNELKTARIDKELNTIMLNSLFGSGNVFYVENDEVTLDGEYIKSLNLTEGDHLIGAVFDNTEKTTDIKKVILTIQGKEDGGNTENPGGGNENPGGGNENPGDGNTGGGNTDGGNTGGGNTGGGNTGGGSTGGGNSGGGNTGGGSGNGGGSNGGPGASDGNNSTNVPSVPDTGGSFVVNPENPKDVEYVKPDGSKAKDEWVGNGKNWYHINDKSKMDFDWFLDKDSRWYMLDRDEKTQTFGAAKYGWYFETKDQRWYYLDTATTAMKLDWQTIDGKSYFFTPVNGGQTYFGDNLTGWNYDNNTLFRPLGSMYCNEMTPDGKQVGLSGALIK